LGRWPAHRERRRGCAAGKSNGFDENQHNGKAQHGRREF